MKHRGLQKAVQSGLKALGGNSSRVVVGKPRKVTHSVALDEALASLHPNDPRWDYGIGLVVGQRSAIAWVEVHTATSGEVSAVLAKLAWLKAWLNGNADACGRVASSFHWAATDAGVHIDSARRRRLNAAGLAMPSAKLRL